MLRPQDLSIFEIGEIVDRFAASIVDLDNSLKKDTYDIISRIMPLLDDQFFAEAAVGALAYNLWAQYPMVPKEDMEHYTDAIIRLGSDLVECLEFAQMYNTDGVCVYTFGRFLGPDIVMQIKDLPSSEYQVF